MIHQEAAKLVAEIHEKAKLLKPVKPPTEAQTAVIYEATWKVLRKWIEAGGVTIPDFGKFSKRKRKAGRQAQNFKAHERITLPESCYVHFKACEAFKRKLNPKSEK
jgi:nucleoid DNA-binding protein